MNNDITLVILAAGMGSRFGGLKQIEPIGPNGEFIIDYSIYDAIRVGFNKIVFIIKEENYEIFKKTIGNRIEKFIKVEYCFQKNDNLPEGYTLPENRIKPLGTAHAILCAKYNVNEPFMTINADDFYGLDAYKKAAEFLKSIKNEVPYLYGLVGYQIKNVITENGTVKRGLCKLENGILKRITESIVERKENGKIFATALSNQSETQISDTDIASMNMLLFTPSIFEYIEKEFINFLENNKDNLSSCEYLIPEVMYSAIKSGYANIRVLETISKWYGVTYKEDLEDAKTSILKLVKDGTYPRDLWNQ